MESAQSAGLLDHLHVVINSYAPLIAVAAVGLTLAVAGFVVLSLVVAIALERRRTQLSRVCKRAYATLGSAARVHQAA